MEARTFGESKDALFRVGSATFGDPNEVVSNDTPRLGLLGSPSPDPDPSRTGALSVSISELRGTTSMSATVISDIAIEGAEVQVKWPSR